MKFNLAFFSAIIPLAVIAIGLIGWVVTLRADLNVAQAQVVEIRESIPPLQAEAKQCAIEIHNLHELIKDIDKIEEVVEDIDVLVFQIGEMSEDVDKYGPDIENLKRNLAIANDQMRTIMSDHAYMGDMLSELGKSQPSGERRDYGGYGGY
tara:strand:+ start:3080 stop:3532 length:453 start_codon:yes stop_codon:yes gene_type:complete